MEKLSLETRITLVRLFYENGSSAADALRKFKTLNGLRKDPFSATTIQRLMCKFETEGVVTNLPRSGRPSVDDSVTEKVGKTLHDMKATSHFQICSARQVARQTGIPKTTVLKVLKRRLAMYPYRLQLVHDLKETDYQSRLQFAEWFLDKLDDGNLLDAVLATSC